LEMLMSCQIPLNPPLGKGEMASLFAEGGNFRFFS
jgi:hypothetical protein